MGVSSFQAIRAEKLFEEGDPLEKLVLSHETEIKHAENRKSLNPSFGAGHKVAFCWEKN